MYIVLLIIKFKAFIMLILTCCLCIEQDSNGGIGLFWGIAADGSAVISENLDLIKASCAKSFAPFPTGM